MDSLGLRAGRFSDVPVPKVAARHKPARFGRGRVRAHPKGVRASAFHALHFSPGATGYSTGYLMNFSFVGAAMEQKQLALMGRLDGPSVASPEVVALAVTYRQAVRLAWAHRRIHFATLRQLAAETGMTAQHVSDYMHNDDRPARRDLPAQWIAAFEAFVGNTIVTQWLAAQARLTVLEGLQAERMVA